MHELSLYNYFRSSTSFRVRIALELKNLEYTYKPVHLLNNGGEQHLPEYRKLNPLGGVPTLVHKFNSEELILGQSLAIINYLDEAFPKSYQLFPKVNPLRSQVLQFCEMINADTHAYSNLKTLKYLEKELHVSEEQKTKWIQHFMLNSLEACETFITPTAEDYCFGSIITAAELFLIPQLFTAQRFNVPLASVPKLQKIYERCLHLEAFKKAHPFRQPDTPAELKLDQ